MKEVWKKICSFPGYEASSEGRICDEYGKILTQGYSEEGYPRVSLRKKNDKWFSRTVHTLVCEAFHGMRPSEKHDCRHLDGSKDNNIPSNLKWGTRKENVADNIKHGTFIYGERQGRSTLSNKQVIEIKKKYAAGVRQYILAEKYKVSKQHISRIVNGQRRAKDHLSGRPDETRSE